MTNLKGKNILMFSPYGATKHYGEAIKNELLNRGANVYSYDERPSQRALAKIIIRCFKKRIPQIFVQYVDAVIKKNRYVEFDYILICRGEAFTELAINHLKRTFNKAKFILYLWDVLETTNIREIIHCFDKAMSFDPNDVATNEKLEFRPTFFIPEYANLAVNTLPKYDIIFIGTLHSNRHKLVKYFQVFFSAKNMTFFVYLYVPGILFYIKNLIRKFPYIGVLKVRFKPISLHDSIAMTVESKAILDLSYKNQKGLTMRAYEALAARRKYITNNQEIKKYDLYDENNICVIDINAPIVPQEFINSPFVDIEEHVMYKYSIQGFVDDLFLGV